MLFWCTYSLGLTCFLFNFEFTTILRLIILRWLYWLLVAGNRNQQSFCDFIGRIALIYYCSAGKLINSGKIRSVIENIMNTIYLSCLSSEFHIYHQVFTVTYRVFFVHRLSGSYIMLKLWFICCSPVTVIWV